MSRMNQRYNSTAVTRFDVYPTRDAVFSMIGDVGQVVSERL